MIVQISAGQGPEECQIAVEKLFEAWKRECPGRKEKGVLLLHSVFHSPGSVGQGRNGSLDMQKPGKAGT